MNHYDIGLVLKIKVKTLIHIFQRQTNKQTFVDFIPHRRVDRLSSGRVVIVVMYDHAVVLWLLLVLISSAQNVAQATEEIEEQNNVNQLS